MTDPTDKDEKAKHASDSNVWPKGKPIPPGLPPERAPDNAEKWAKWIPFDWRELPRIQWPDDKVHIKSFHGWTFQLESGQDVDVHSLHQEYIYAGHLLGGLHRPDRYLLEAIARAVALFPHDPEPPVILPPSLFWGRVQRVVNDKDASYDWMSLPRVRCIAYLQSNTPARDASEVFSSCVVIWFQDHFGMPDEQVQNQLKSLKWRKVAMDWTP